MTRDELLAQLNKLLPAQLEEVLFRVGLPQAYLSAISAPQAARAIEVIRYLEPQNRLADLAQAVEAVVGTRASAAAGDMAGTAAKPRARSGLATSRPRAMATLVVAAATGAAALALLALVVANGQTLVAVGLTGHVWYVLLLLLGLFAAVAVFSLFRSYARYRGKAAWGTLELGGPVVVMLVVIVLGFALVPAPAQSFDVTVFFHGAAGRQAMVLRKRGKASLDLGADKRVEAVGDKGEARFTGIPSNLRGHEVALGLSDEVYELVNPGLAIRLSQDAVYAAIQPRQLPLVGFVSDEHGDPLPGARARIAGAAATTDPGGRFEIKLPADLPEGERSISITAAGHEPWTAQVVPGGDPIRVRLLLSSPRNQ